MKQMKLIQKKKTYNHNPINKNSRQLKIEENKKKMNLSWNVINQGSQYHMMSLSSSLEPMSK